MEPSGQVRPKSRTGDGLANRDAAEDMQGRKPPNVMRSCVWCHSNHPHPDSQADGLCCYAEDCGVNRLIRARCSQVPVKNRAKGRRQEIVSSSNGSIFHGSTSWGPWVLSKGLVKPEKQDGET